MISFRFKKPYVKVAGLQSPKSLFDDSNLIMEGLSSSYVPLDMVFLSRTTPLAPPTLIWKAEHLLMPS